MNRNYVNPTPVTGDVIVRGVTVVDTADGSRMPDQDVRVQNGTVIEIGRITATAPNEIDGRGRFAVPAFSDMHAHALNTPEDVDGAYALMLAAGISGFRQMSGSPDLLARRREGRLPRPLGAPELLGTPGDLLSPMNSATVEQVTATVRQQQADGADFVKAALIGGDIFRAALAESARIGIPLVGHLPADVDARAASNAGMRSMEHLGPGPSIFAAASGRAVEILARTGSSAAPKIPSVKLPGMDRMIGKIIQGIVVNPATRTSPESAESLRMADDAFDEEAAATLARLFVENETWQCPTLIRVHTQQLPNAAEHRDDARLRFIRPDELKRWRKSADKFAKLPALTRETLEQHFDAQLRMTKLFADAGVPMLAGTDADGAGWVIPGFGLHDEFDLLARAGLDPLKILQLATVEPARFLGRDSSAGRLQVGSPADLVLLADDPIANHAALHSIEGVLRAGSYWSRAELDAILDRVADAPGAA